MVAARRWMTLRYLISPQAQQAHVVSYLAGKMDASLAEEMGHVDQPRAIPDLISPQAQPLE